MFFCLLVFNFSSADDSFSSSICTMENTNVLYFQNPLLTDGPKKVPADEQQLITHPCLAGIAHLSMEMRQNWEFSAFIKSSERL